MKYSIEVAVQRCRCWNEGGIIAHDGDNCGTDFVSIYCVVVEEKHEFLSD
jgi:hypothetical protein